MLNQYQGVNFLFSKYEIRKNRRLYNFLISLNHELCFFSQLLSSSFF